MNAVNHMAQSETKEYAIANHKKKETHIRKKKSCLEKCLISIKQKKIHSERKTRKSSIRINNPVQSVWEVILKIKTHTHTPTVHYT